MTSRNRFAILLSIFFILFSCNNQPIEEKKQDEENNKWDISEIKLSNNVDNSEFSNIDEINSKIKRNGSEGDYDITRRFFQRQSGSSGIVGQWSVHTNKQSAEINGEKQDYYPLEQIFIFNSDGTFSRDIINSFPKTYKVVSSHEKTEGTYTLVKENNIFRVIMVFNGSSSFKKYNYKVSNGYLSFSYLSQIEQELETEKKHNIITMKEIHSMLEVSESIDEANDGDLFILDVPTNTNVNVRDLFGAASNKARYVGFDLSKVESYTYYTNSYELKFIFYLALPNNLSELKEHSFSKWTDLQTVILPNSITFIPQYCFYNCRSLHEIKLPDNISEIGYMAFHSSGITSIELPETVTLIGDEAFIGCSLLQRITLKSKEPPIYEGSNHIFGYLPDSNIEIFVPEGSIESYKQADTWNYYSTRIKEYH